MTVAVTQGSLLDTRHIPVDPGRGDTAREGTCEDPGSVAWPSVATRAFVGRERDLEELKLVLDEAVSDRGSLVLLAGEPGIGKTRLACVALTRDNAGHVTAARSNKHTTGTLNGTSSYQLFANATYTPWGAPFGRLLGNGLTESKTYDNRERLLSSSQFQAG